MNVLLFVVDSARRDVWNKVVGHIPGTIEYTNCMTCSDLTCLSLYQMMTGHLFDSEKRKDIFHHLRQLGYKTDVVVLQYDGNPLYPLDHNTDHWVNIEGSPGRSFTYIHHYSVHAPYLKITWRMNLDELLRDLRNSYEAGKVSVRDLRRRYKKRMKDLKRDVLPDLFESYDFVILVGDHGENLGYEKGLTSSFRDQLHNQRMYTKFRMRQVPLVIKTPDWEDQIIHDPVDGSFIYQTILRIIYDENSKLMVENLGWGDAERSMKDARGS